jgi:hypothetical protein
MTAMAEEVINTDADFAVDYPAAPAVAGLLLEEAGIDNRYGSGRDGGNYIRDVAHEMGAETDFWGVPKTDVIAYECAVAAFLREKGAPVTASGTGVVDAAASGAVATDNADGTTTLVITVVDLCGDPITGLDPTTDFYVTDSVIAGQFYFGTGSIPGSGADKWDVATDGTYAVTLERNFFNARPAGYNDGWYRVWDIYVKGELVEQDLILQTTYYAVGDWQMDLTAGSNIVPRFVIIESHVEGEIEGFFGVGYDPEGDPTGTISGTIVGQVIEMTYDRTGYADTGYMAWFEGTIANDGNSMSGTWLDNNMYTTPQNWSMVRQ